MLFLLLLAWRWTAGPPLVAPLDRGGDHYYSVKDPSIVRYQGRWHVFTTVRGQARSHQIEYFSFADWADAGHARRAMLHVTNGYFCAPEVFYFRPHRKWYLVYQVIDKTRQPALQPAFSTTSDIADPDSWTPPALLFSEPPQGIKSWIDFWVIADERQAHLFFTSNDGRMWRADAPLGDFPHGWTEPRVVLQGDIYEASHTYRLKGRRQYLTVVEAQGAGGRRFYRAYLANKLDGAWTEDGIFASPENVSFSGERWTDSFSHGELLRDGYDQTLTVDPRRLAFLYQGVSDRDRAGKPYGQIPWRLGLLEPVTR